MYYIDNYHVRRAVTQALDGLFGTPGKANMAYCAICGRHHEPGAGCLDGTGEILEEAGMSSPSETSKEELEQITKGADRWFLKMLLWALAAIVLLFIISSYFSKSR